MDVERRIPPKGILHTMCVTLLITMIASGSAVAQTLPFHHLSARDGLVSNNITSFCQDGRGRLWIGAETGLSVFDGISFRNFTAEHGLTSGFIFAITKDPQDNGAIWAATMRGLVHASDRGLRVLQDSGSDRTWITDVTVSPRGTLWVATAGGLRRLVDGRLRRVGIPAHVGIISKMSVTPDGLLWLLSSRGIFRYDPGAGRCAVIDTTLGMYRGATFLTHDRRGNVFVCAHDSSIIQIRRGVFHRRYPFARVQPYSIAVDNHDALWVACDSGLYHFPSGITDQARAIRYTRANGLPVNYLQCAFFDSERNLWFGTAGRGITRLEDWHTMMYRDMTVTGLGALDQRGHLWLSAEDGLWEFWERSPSDWERRLHRPAAGWPKGFPFRLAIGPDNALWASFNSGAITRFKIIGGQEIASQLRVDGSFSGTDSLPLLNSFTMCIDRKGRLWCSFPGGNMLMLEGKPPFRTLRHYRGLPHDVRTMYEDLQGKIWIGGYNNGVCVIDGNDLSLEPRMIGQLDSSSVRGFLMDRKGRMWIGTLPHGLTIIDNGTMRRFTRADGLLSNSIYSFAQGPDGTVWMGTLVGMAYARENSFAFRWTQELTDSPVWDCGVREDGVLWVATRFGLTLFNAPQSTSETTPPKISITGLYVNGQPVPVQASVDLGSTNRNCRVEFSTVRLRRPRDIRYQYMLAGIDSVWSPPSAERSLTLAGLRPGTYTLLIRAISSEQSGRSESVRLQLVVSRPFWQSWWFILLVIAVIGGVLSIIIRGRVRRLIEIERIRSRIAADLHDDIGSGLTRIALMTEVMQRQVMSLKDQESRTVVTDLRGAMDRVGTISRELVDGMSDVVWSIDPRNDSLARLIDRITVFTNDLCESRDIAAIITAPDALRDMHTSSDLSRTVLLVCKEAINNAARHSEASELHVEFRVAGQHLHLRIKDNGRGFEETGLSRINGLVNMRNRVEKAGGRIEIASTPGAGTDITVTIPMHD